MPEQDQSAQLFAGLTIERSEALPKRIVAGRESIPNPFLDAVMDSYRESKEAGQDKAVRAIYVPVDAKGTTVRTVTRKDKNGKVTGAQWQQHPNVNTALYLLRQAAIKHDIGVRIVVDYSQQNVPTVTTKVDDKNVTLTDVTLNRFKAQTSGTHKGLIRIRFLGQAKKEKKATEPTTANTAAPAA